MNKKLILVFKFCIVIILLSFLAQGQKNAVFTGESNDIRLANIISTDVYTINENNSAFIEEYLLITYFKPENNVISVRASINFTSVIMSASNEETYNYSIASTKKFEKNSFTSFVPISNTSSVPNSSVYEDITPFSTNFYKHTIKYPFNTNSNNFDEFNSDLYQFQFMVNNISFNYKDIYTLIIPKIMISSVQNSSAQIRVNLPNSPYYYAEYISSNVKPTEIVTDGTSQSIFWDNAPQIDIILFYRLIENPVNKKTTELQTETNKLEEQAYKSSILAIIFGIISIAFAFHDVYREFRNKK